MPRATTASSDNNGATSAPNARRPTLATAARLAAANQLARGYGVLKGALPWVGTLAGAIWLLDPLNGFHMIAETTSVLGFLLYAAWATGLARAR